MSETAPTTGPPNAKGETPIVINVSVFREGGYVAPTVTSIGGATYIFKIARLNAVQRVVWGRAEYSHRL
jgi:hypothetical protein